MESVNVCLCGQDECVLRRTGFGKKCVLGPNICAENAVETARALMRIWELDIYVKIGRGMKVFVSVLN